MLTRCSTMGNVFGSSRREWLSIMCITQLLVMMVLLMMYSVSAMGESSGGWSNSLAPKGKPGGEVTLALDGKTDYAILLPANATTQDRKAADDLKGWLDKMTGADFRVVIEGQAAERSRIISIGQTRALSELSNRVGDLGKDGYAILQQKEDLFLLGGSRRGPINAVYALLEEDLGCRWYDRSSSAIPHRPDLTFAPVPRTYVPVLDIRDPFYYDAFDRDWSVRNRTIAPLVAVPEKWGGTTDYAWFGHSFEWLVPPEEHFDTHPEYFSEIAGERRKSQLCLTNPDVLRISIDKIRGLLKSRPNSELMSVSVNDRRGYCECDKCKAINDPEGTFTATLVLFCNAIADAIKDEFPNLKISTLAYMDVTEAPKTIKPRDNVVIQLCTDRHAWSRPFLTVLDTQRFQNAMKGWHKLGANLSIWDYTENYHHYPIVRPNWQVVDENIEIYIRHGAKGIMLQGNHLSFGGENAVMRSWVWAKKLWDPSLDSKELMRDFVFGYYREAAEPIWDYTTMLWDMWENYQSKPKEENLLLCGVRFYPDILFLQGDQFLTRARALMSRAEKLAEDPLTRRRVAAARFPLLYLEISQNIGFVDYYKVFQPRISRSAKSTLRQAELLNEFKAIAKAEGITHIREGKPDFDIKLKQLRDALESDLGGSVVNRLSDCWKTKADPDDVGVNMNWFAVGLNDSTWTDNPLTQGISWHRQAFEVPAEMNSYKHAYLWFDSVGDEAWVYVNGKQIFEHTNHSTALPMLDLRQRPFFFDAVDALHSGSNTLVVRTKSNGSPAGVHKPVYLILTDHDDLPRRP